MIFRILFLFVFILFTRSAHSQLPENYFQRFPAQIRKDIRHLGAEMAATEYSFVSAYRESLETYEKREDKKDEIVLPADSLALIRTLRTTPANAFILAKSDQHRVIFINEAHHQPAHRLFVASLLPDLYRKGFRYLSLEALPGGVEVSRKQPLTSESGIYPNEPAFAKLIDEAIRLGFQVSGHEADGEDIRKNREAGQAKHVKRLIDEDPAARVLVYCGYNHIKEGGTSDRRMASFFHEMTGIDPLTINQSELSETDTSPHPIFREVSVDVPSVFLNASDEPIGFAESDGHRVDMVVIHPYTTYESGRPSFLWQNPTYRKWPVPGIQMPYPILVTAFREGLSTRTDVPLDRIVIEHKKEQKALALPTGTYRMVFRSQSGKREVRRARVE